MGKWLSQQIQKDTQMANKHMERSWVSLILGEESNLKWKSDTNTHSAKWLKLKNKQINKNH